MGLSWLSPADPYRLPSLPQVKGQVSPEAAWKRCAPQVTLTMNVLGGWGGIPLYSCAYPPLHPVNRAMKQVHIRDLLASLKILSDIKSLHLEFCWQRLLFA